ncbi:hypothetical protein DEIPH_ctg064orf0095 [Deinococcus phoenicis]|uniref:Uncharacterized protein n=1 Tax=Deinococcus phoenicis TaxID=1476583 RepID=A0A016QLH9_9DEIO|nr:hypothetical protein [Deinococcus phoenicis]EYB66918.1 hypothetical protein DEIPH_ctg064orf0095 [Deinococcus phoenicis]
MRPFLTVLLLLAPTASAAPPAPAALTRTVTVVGHSAGAFGLPSQPYGPLAGGVAWSADGQEVSTLDTTRTLKRWRTADGALLETRKLSPPATVPDASLILEGGAPGGSLMLQAHGYRENRPVSLRYHLNLKTGAQTPQAACAPSAATLNTCTPDGRVRAWIEGGELNWQRAGAVTHHTLPAGLAPRLESGQSSGALALSPDGSRAALLTLQSQDVVFGGQGVLLTWALDADGGVTARQTVLTGPRLYPGATLRWTGQGWLLAANAYNTGDENGSGGARSGQLLAFFGAAGKQLWSLSPGVNLRGAWPSPDGARFVTLREGSLPEMRRTSDGAFLRGLGESVVSAVPLSGERALLALNRGGGAGRIARADGGRLTTLAPLKVDELAASLGGQRFASAQNRLVRVHGASGAVLKSWNAAGRVDALAFSPDGQVLSARVWGRPQAQVQAWTLDGTPLKLPAGAIFPVSAAVFRKANDKNGPQQGYRERLSVSTREGKPLWDTGWQRGSVSVWPSADGRAAALSGMDPQARVDPVTSVFRRVNARTGQAGPSLFMKPTTQDPNSGWGLSALEGTGRLALLAEGGGDGCGWGLYGYALADLQTGRRLPTPPQLASGYQREGGCGFNVPFLQAAFAPDAKLLIRDGNRLDWWTIPGYSLPGPATGPGTP